MEESSKPKPVAMCLIDGSIADEPLRLVSIDKPHNSVQCTHPAAVKCALCALPNIVAVLLFLSQPARKGFKPRIGNVPVRQDKHKRVVDSAKKLLLELLLDQPRSDLT